ncbi:unnamed protein product [Microthlaspi erraticum]|uniref:F-box associated beta-propeller type 3 domain-containing protein n=1 Tax=Microthlaspi erraticum TaxID=1685480 RepID=A0A6D2L3D2_9BRAS|nr:unnamed protein product [Microthlaspi erraticum]
MYSIQEGICIDGVLYYSSVIPDERSYVLVCFNVRSEKFKFIDVGWHYGKLINYKGKVCSVLRYASRVRAWSRALELRMLVLEDVEKGEWSEYVHVYTLRDDEFLDDPNDFHDISVAGVTATGEFVLSPNNTYRPFYVYYFNPERNTLQRVEIQGFGTMFSCCNNDAYAFVDHVEDLKFNITETTPMSQPGPGQKRKPKSVSTSSKPHLQQHRGTFEIVNKFNALCLLDDD